MAIRSAAALCRAINDWVAEEWLDEVINKRKLPGEGEFPIRDYVRVFRELGYGGPWGVEVLSEELRNLPIEEIFEARRQIREGKTVSLERLESES